MRGRVEPSVKYGTKALDVLGDALDAPGPATVDFDSSAPEGGPRPRGPLVALVVGFVVLTVSSLVVVAIRWRQRETSTEER